MEKSSKISSLNIDKDVLNILASRGITKKEDIINFIHPDIKNLSNPCLLADLEKACDRILLAIKRDEKICIYGDYDVDGITSTSILYLAFKKLGAKYVDFYIPIRDEGYGLNNEALDKIKQSGTDLVITVDCGITSYKEINYANSLGLCTIITDHHNLLDPVVPNAYAVVNPKRLENKYPFKELAGVGTAFMVVLELFRKCNIYDEAFSYIDLVAIGTIADVVPLVSENRIIVKYGLEKLKETKNLGLKMLLDKVFPNKFDEFSSGDISFTISPIFNASGRLKDAKLVVYLLISNNEKEIQTIITELLLKNDERKEIQNNIFELAKTEVEKFAKDDYILVSSSPKYHHGVIGIVAAKLVDIYFKPCIVLEEKTDEGIAVASCRSIPNFDITRALQYCGNLLLKFGGHTGAAGFTIEIKNINTFREKINEYAKNILKEDDFYKTIDIDQVIPIQKISYEFFKTLELLKPFGFGNPTPTFLTKNIIVENTKLIGASKNHLSFDFSQKGYLTRGAVWFSKANLLNSMSSNIFYDIVFKINVNLFKGKYYTKVLIDDMKESVLEKDDKFSFLKSLYEMAFPMKSVFYSTKTLDVKDNITMEYTTFQVNLYNGRNFVGKLDDNISRTLIQLKSLYNFDFKIKIEKVNVIDDVNNINILISRNYELKCYKKDDKNIFNFIKSKLLGKLDYDSTTKLALSSLFKDNKNILLSKKNINTPLSYNIFLNFAIYNFIHHNNTALLSNDKKLLRNKMLSFYTTKDENAKYAIIDKNTYKNEIDFSKYEKIILIDDSIDNLESFKSIKNMVNIPTNVIELNKNNIQKYGDSNICTKFLPLNDKLEIKEKLKNNEIILADNSIYEIL